MAVSYTKAQRETAKREGLHLVTLAARGVEVQAPVTEDEANRIVEYIHDLLARRREFLKSRKQPTV